MVSEGDAPPLLTGEPCVHPDEFLRRTGLTGDDMATLLAEGLLVGGYDQRGALRVIFLDPLPDMEQMRSLGMSPVPDYVESLHAASTVGDSGD